MISKTSENNLFKVPNRWNCWSTSILNRKFRTNITNQKHKTSLWRHLIFIFSGSKQAPITEKDPSPSNRIAPPTAGTFSDFASGRHFWNDVRGRRPYSGGARPCSPRAYRTRTSFSTTRAFIGTVIAVRIVTTLAEPGPRRMVQSSYDRTRGGGGYETLLCARARVCVCTLGVRTRLSWRRSGRPIASRTKRGLAAVILCGDNVHNLFPARRFFARVGDGHLTRRGVPAKRARRSWHPSIHLLLLIFFSTSWPGSCQLAFLFGLTPRAVRFILSGSKILVPRFAVGHFLMISKR